MLPVAPETLWALGMVVDGIGAFEKVILMVTELPLLDLGMYFLISEAAPHRPDNVLERDCNRHLSVATSCCNN